MLGRFLGRDPIQEKGGLHLYGFAGNNSVNRWDYLGNNPLSASQSSIGDLMLSDGGALEGFSLSYSNQMAALANSSLNGPLSGANDVYFDDGSPNAQVPNPSAPLPSASQVQQSSGNTAAGPITDATASLGTATPNNGTSALGNALGQIPLIGGVLGGVGNLVSGVGNVALGALTGNSSDIEDGVSEFGNGVGGIVGGSLDLAGKAWTFPNTAIGLTAGLVGWALGGEAPVVRNNAIVFVNSPVLPGGLTLGNVILLGTGFGPTGPDSGPNFPEANGPVIDHEEQHTYQGQLLGPLYLPANGIGGLSSMVQAPSGTYVPWHYNNFMENGPQSSPPSPWPP